MYTCVHVCHTMLCTWCRVVLLNQFLCKVRSRHCSLAYPPVKNVTMALSAGTFMVAKTTTCTKSCAVML